MKRTVLSFLVAVTFVICAQPTRVVAQIVPESVAEARMEAEQAEMMSDAAFTEAFTALLNITDFLAEIDALKVRGSAAWADLGFITDLGVRDTALSEPTRKTSRRSNSGGDVRDFSDMRFSKLAVR